jgi:hypothetical protein
VQFSEIRQELKDRGFDHAASTNNNRVDRWVNQSYQSICDSQQWAFLEADASGSAPLTVSDLRAVLSVVDSTQKRQLPWINRQTLIKQYDTDLTTTGTPTCWYQDAQYVIDVYPANTSDTISVHYLKIPTTLSGDTDEPVFDSRFHDVIVDGAVVRGYKDTDQWEAAQQAQAYFALELQRMSQALLSRHHDTTDFILMTDSYEAGGY